MEKETLQLTKPLEFKDFINLLDYSDDNVIVGESVVGHWKEQIVPTLYFRQNEYYRIDFNSASSGYLLKFISTEQNVSFSIEFLDTIFLDYYKILNNRFSLIKCIKRSELIRFENKGNIKFMGVKAKNTYKFMKGMSGAPIGGLITGFIFRGAFKLAAKVEDDLVEKDGAHFSLYFLENDEEKNLDVVVESFYIKDFTEILRLNWTANTPEKPKVKVKKGGCFIATACYNDYDHPIVFQLRIFRDHFLNEKKWGRKFISFYYKHSPRHAKLIQHNGFLKYFYKAFLIIPLYYISKILYQK